jgi:hypothetical protein
MSKNTCVNVIITHENPYNHVFFDIYVFIIEVFMSNDNVDTCIFRHLRVFYRGFHEHVDVEKYTCQRSHYS